MQTYLDCYPCLVRHALEAVRLTGMDEEGQERVIHGVLGCLGALAPAHTPVRLAAEIHRLIRDITGIDDPYARVKEQANAMALAHLPELRRHCAAAPDPLNTAARIAIAGNIIDHGSLGEAYDLSGALAECLGSPLDIDDFGRFRRDLHTAERIVYVADNTGEIAFDRLFLEEIRKVSSAEIAVVVRGSPILNDATIEDARHVGLAEHALVVASGPGAPGCELARAPQEVRALFTAADLILSKGQGNYEALSEEPYPIYFLLKVKCPVIGRDIGSRKGAAVFKRSFPEGSGR